MFRYCRYSVALILLGVASVPVTLGLSLPKQPAGVVRAPVYVDDSPAAEDLIDRARDLREQARLREAANTYQEVIEQYARKLTVVEEGLYRDTILSVRIAVWTDSELLEAYRRVYGTVADRAFEEASQPIVREDALVEVIRKFGLCRAGLDASLHLAAWHLERGSPADALVVLDDMRDHPDLEHVTERWHLLQGIAGLYKGDADLMRRHQRALDTAGHDKSLAQLRALGSVIEPPVIAPSFDALYQLPRLSVGEPTTAPLWHLYVPTPLPTVLQISQFTSRPGKTNAADTLQFHYMLPVAKGDHVFINDGGTVLSLERHTGAKRWAFSLVEPDNARKLHTLRQNYRLVPDHRGVALSTDHLVAVMGYQSQWINRSSSAFANSTLVCLRAHDGELRWRVSPRETDASLDQAYFHGTPVINGGMVFALVRRSPRARFQDAFALAFDLPTGKLVWRRHLASAMPSRRQFAPARAQIMIKHGRLFVADDLGAVTCLDTRTGTARWVRVMDQLRLSATTRNYRTIGAAPWQISLPVPVASGLVVRLGGSGAEGTLLDPESGLILRKLDQSPVTNASYLVGVDGDLLCVGSALWRLDGRDFKPKWRRVFSDHMGKPRSLQGRASVTAEHVIVPLSNALAMVDLEDGTLVEEHEIWASGSVLALPDQIVVAGVDTVSGYMPWANAYARSKKRIAEFPKDPQPAMALAQLAWASQREQFVLEAVDAAILALDKRHHDRSDAGVRRPDVDPVQQEVFLRLLEFARDSRRPNNAQRHELFRRIASITATPADEVAYRLGLGAFLTEIAEHAAAIERYQSILDDRTLSNQMYQHLDGAWLASLEAQMRQQALIDQFGRDVYRYLEERAVQQLDLVSMGETVRPSQFIEVARRFPVSRTASEACLLAADRFAEVGRIDEAVNQLQHAYRQTNDRRAVQRVVSRLVDLSLMAGRVDQAKQWLRRVQRDHGELDLLRGGEPYPVNQWLADLPDSPQRDGRYPTLRLPLEGGVSFQGELLLPRLQARDTWPRDRVLLRNGHRLQLRVGPDMQPEWTVSVPSVSRVELLVLDDTQTLLWDARIGRLMALDVQDGRMLWRHDNTKTLLAAVAGDDDVDERANRIERRLPAAAELKRWQPEGRQADNEGPFLQDGGIELPNLDLEPLEVEGRAELERLLAMQGVQARKAVQAGVHFGLNKATLVLANARGHVIGIDRRSGHVKWSHRCPVVQLTHLMMQDQTVALAGTLAGRGGANRAVIQVLDVGGGRERPPAIPIQSAVTWMGMRGEENLWYTTGKLVVCYSLLDHVVIWQRQMATSEHRGATRLGEGVLMLTTKQRRIAVLDASTGRTLSDGDSPLTFRQGQPVQIHAVEGNWLVLSPDRLIALGSGGRLEWADAIGDAEKRFITQVVGSEHVVAVNQLEAVETLEGAMRNAEDNDEPMAAQQNVRPARRRRTWRYRLYVLDRRHGLIVHQRDLPPLETPLRSGHALLLDNHLVLSTGSRVIAISGRSD